VQTFSDVKYSKINQILDKNFTKLIGSSNLLYFNHGYGIKAKDFFKNKNITDFFYPILYARD